MASVLIVSFVEWAGAFQRPQHLALGLAHRGWRVTYASPGYLHRRGARFASGLELPAGLRVVEPAQLPGSSRLGALARLNQTLMRLGLRRQAPWDAIIFNDPRWAPVVERLPAATRIFDCMDDLSGISHSAAWAAAMERRALGAADRVWTGTGMLADRLAGRHASVRFIPGGVDWRHFSTPDAAAVAAAARELPPGEGPLAGYFGVLNERFDMERVEALLDAGWRVLLIGPATSRAPRLPERAAIRWIGPRPYADLPAWLAHFDLGLIPYHTGGAHQFLFPVKALEYLAGGKPVLSTPLPDMVRFLGSAVELADSAADWRAAGERLRAPGEEVAQRLVIGRRLARERSWDAMVDAMEQALQASLAEART